MDGRSDDEMDYKINRYKSRRESSESPLSISDDDEEDANELLEIKPPQAKISRRSHAHRSDKHSTSGRQVYVSSSHRRHKLHHSHRHQEDRYMKDRFETDFKSSGRSAHLKDYEDRLKEHEEYRRSKGYQSRREDKRKEERYKPYEDENYRLDDRYKDQDLREKIERRKLHHQKEYDRKDKDRKEKGRRERLKLELELKEQRELDGRKRRHREERKRPRTPEKIESPRHDKASLQSISEDSFSPNEKEMVIDIEVSPPVMKGQYSDGSQEKEEVEEENSESSSDSSNSSSNSSSGSTESNSTDSSSEEEGEEEEEEEEDVQVPDKESKEQENDIKLETNHDSIDGDNIKEETPPRKVATNDDVDTEIELEKDTLPSYFPAIQGCRSVEEFQCLNRIEEGTYGVVYRAREKRTDKIVALKRLKMEKEKEGFPITSLREINTLLKAQHPNIVTVKEIVVGSNMDKIFIVMDYVEHDLKSLMETMKQKKTSFIASEVKCLMQQLLKAVNHLHDNWILHRDLKTSNLLFSHTGVLKVGDFGLAREYGSPLKNYTPVVVTLWYRAPELLLGTKEYSTSIDMWSVGCIFAEFLCMEPLFPGKTEVDQLRRIFKALGTPNEKIWPEYPKLPLVQKVSLPEFPAHGFRSKFVPSILTESGYDLLSSLLMYNTKKRITADAALKHEYFSEHPLPVDPAMFPTWPAKSEPGYRKVVASSPKPPSGGQNYKELREDDGFYIGVGERNSRPGTFNLQSTMFNLKF